MKLPVTLCMRDGFFFFCILLIFSILKINVCIVSYLYVYSASENVYLPFTSPFSSFLHFFFLFRTPAMKHSPLGFLFSTCKGQILQEKQNSDFWISVFCFCFLKIIYHSLEFCTLTRISGLYLLYLNDYFLLLHIIECGSWLAVKRLV